VQEREDPKTASELRGLEIEYEKKKSQMMAIHGTVSLLVNKIKSKFNLFQSQ
jgi:hypothetical protein